MALAELRGVDEFLEVLGYREQPLALLYSDEQPDGGFSPPPGELPTKEKEDQGAIDWGAVFGNFSCVMGNIWRARKKHDVAWMSAEHYGCPGGAFYLGYLKPQTDLVCAYVSSGIPGALEGENYVKDPVACRAFFEAVDPLPAPRAYTVFKPLDLLQEGEEPEAVCFFARPEVLSGLDFLTMYVTGDIHAVSSPFGAGCANLVTFARQFHAKNQLKAVLGGWDPSCRKYLKTDELTFTATWPLFQAMLAQWKDSFLTKGAWGLVQKKIARSERAWGEDA